MFLPLCRLYLKGNYNNEAWLQSENVSIKDVLKVLFLDPLRASLVSPCSVFFLIVHSCNMMLYKYSQICGKVTKPLRLKSLHFVVLQGVISDSSSFHIRLTLRHLTRLKVCLKQRMKERRGKLVCSDSTIYSLPDWIFFFF